MLASIRKAEADLATREAAWPAQTDNDKLTAAFGKLNEAGIYAVEHFGAMASDAGELYGQIRGDGRWRGYCFYHSQDLVRAVTGGTLMLRYSAAADQPTDDQNRAIGQAVMEALQQLGLKPKWNGDPNTTISLPLTWQRRAALPQPHRSSKPEPDMPYIKPWWKFW